MFEMITSPPDCREGAARPVAASAGGRADPSFDPADRLLTRQGRERKAEILRHAERLFAEQGYDATRIADIMDSSGVAKGLFYWARLERARMSPMSGTEDSRASIP